MGLYKCEAVVLRAEPFSEADRLAVLLSPEIGKVRAVARGAQRGRGHLCASVQPFVSGSFVLWQGRSLDGITQVEVRTAHRGLSQNLEAMLAASYCCDLSDALTEERQEAQALHGALLAALGWIEANPDPAALPVALRWFELVALAASGFGPELVQCTACGSELGEPAARTGFSPQGGGVVCGDCAAEDEAVVWLSRNALRGLRYVAASPPAALAGVRVGPRTMAEMRAALDGLIGHILQRPLKSRALLDTLS